MNKYERLEMIIYFDEFACAKRPFLSAIIIHFQLGESAVLVGNAKGLIRGYLFDKRGISKCWLEDLPRNKVICKKYSSLGPRLRLTSLFKYQTEPCFLIVFPSSFAQYTVISLFHAHAPELERVFSTEALSVQQLGEAQPFLEFLIKGQAGFLLRYARW